MGDHKQLKHGMPKIAALLARLSLHRFSPGNKVKEHAELFGERPCFSFPEVGALPNVHRLRRDAGMQGCRAGYPTASGTGRLYYQFNNNNAPDYA
jgi:hypothetical protein